MFKPVQVGKRTRYTYAKINEVLKMPHLLDLQIKSYEWFLEKGLKDIFRDISPIEDAAGNLSLSFEDFKLGEPKYDIRECKERDTTYAAPRPDPSRQPCNRRNQGPGSIHGRLPADY